MIVTVADRRLETVAHKGWIQFIAIRRWRESDRESDPCLRTCRQVHMFQTSMGFRCPGYCSYAVTFVFLPAPWYFLKHLRSINLLSWLTFDDRLLTNVRIALGTRNLLKLHCGYPPTIDAWWCRYRGLYSQQRFLDGFAQFKHFCVSGADPMNFGNSIRSWLAFFNALTQDEGLGSPDEKKKNFVNGYEWLCSNVIRISTNCWGILKREDEK